MKSVAMSLAAIAAAFAVTARAETSDPVEPLTAAVDDSAAKRFARLWHATGGKPDAAQIQEAYLANGGRGIEVFTRGRIVDAENLAAKVAKHPDVYRDAVERCLPWVAATNAQLRSTYLGLRGLLPDRPLPQISVVIGANNSGGTAAAGIQVIGLEVICRLSPTQADYEQRMRQFFAHETVQTFQQIDGQGAVKQYLVASALAEGVPDYITELVTARVPNSGLDEWARSREQWIWEQFLSDAAIVQAGTDANGNLNETAQAAYYRWFANAGDAPEGWPDELGYLVGMRIAESYAEQAADPYAALDDLLAFGDPAAILEKSNYFERLSRSEEQ